MKKAASTTKRTTSKKPKTEGLGVIGELDRYLFGEGRHYQLYHKLGAHPYTYRGQDGYYFAVWAPHAAAVSLVGDFNAWNPDATPMKPVADSGIYGGAGADPLQFPQLVQRADAAGGCHVQTVDR